MKYKPNEYPSFDKAHVIVGCDCESAHKVYFDKISALKEVDNHAFIAFFDKNGDKFDEVKVVDIFDDPSLPDGEIFVDDVF